MAVSLTLSLWAGFRLSQDPLLRPMIERGMAEIEAALEAEVSRSATPEVVNARLAALLAEEPRNWIALKAVEDLAAERDIPITPENTRRAADLWDADNAITTVAGACVLCAWDAGQCSLSQALICHGPVALTPIGDVMGLGRAGVAAATGAEVDQIDFALSAIGLGATVAVLATGGTSYSLKAGAGLLKMARKMNVIPPRLMALLSDTARKGIRWDEALAWESLTDPARLIVPDVVAPVASVASDLGRIGAKLDTTTTLHMMRYIDGPADAKSIAHAVEALGARSVGIMEVIGKSRFLRAGLRWSDEALALMAGIGGLLTALSMFIISTIKSLALRGLRRGLR